VSPSVVGCRSVPFPQVGGLPASRTAGPATPARLTCVPLSRCRGQGRSARTAWPTRLLGGDLGRARVQPPPPDLERGVPSNLHTERVRRQRDTHFGPSPWPGHGRENHAPQRLDHPASLTLELDMPPVELRPLRPGRMHIPTRLPGTGAARERWPTRPRTSRPSPPGGLGRPHGSSAPLPPRLELPRGRKPRQGGESLTMRHVRDHPQDPQIPHLGVQHQLLQVCSS
jgi:hypothetical protein